MTERHKELYRECSRLRFKKLQAYLGLSKRSDFMDVIPVDDFLDLVQEIQEVEPEYLPVVLDDCGTKPLRSIRWFGNELYPDRPIEDVLVKLVRA